MKRRRRKDRILIAVGIGVVIILLIFLYPKDAGIEYGLSNAWAGHTYQCFGFQTEKISNSYMRKICYGITYRPTCIAKTITGKVGTTTCET